MRYRLADLEPEWLSEPGRPRLGVRFNCEEHSRGCRVEAWFSSPTDGGQAVTSTAGRVLHQHEGEDFETLCLYPPVRHGGCFVHCYEGEVSFC